MMPLNILLLFIVVTFPVTGFQLPEAKDWPQEPNGFNGLRFLTKRAEIEKTHKLGRCKSVQALRPSLESIQCGLPLQLYGIGIDGRVEFTFPKGTRDREGQLTQIILAVKSSDYETAKAMLVKTYGEPHHIESKSEGSALFWNGKKANVQFWKGTTLHTLVVGPSQFGIGNVSIAIRFYAISTIESLPPER
jgi:hypothetical protein